MKSSLEIEDLPEIRNWLAEMARPPRPGDSLSAA
jgi:hypothetical protein